MDHADPNKSNELSEFFLMLARVVIQKPCMDIREFIIEGIGWAWMAKNVEYISDTLKESYAGGLSPDETVKFENFIASFANAETLESMKEFAMAEMKKIDQMVLEGRIIPEKPTTDNPLSLPFNINDPASYLREFAKWLNEYMEYGAR